jgi:hypothetical protein
VRIGDWIEGRWRMRSILLRRSSAGMRASPQRGCNFWPLAGSPHAVRPALWAWVARAQQRFPQHSRLGVGQAFHRPQRPLLALRTGQSP